MTRRERARALYRERKLAGRCVGCGLELDAAWPRVYCATCAARQAAWQAAHLAQRAEAKRRCRARRAA